MVTISNPTGEWTLEIESTTVRLPYQATECAVVGGDSVAALFNTWNPSDPESWEELGFDMSHRKVDPDFELEDPYRNVVGFDAEARLQWIIPQASHEPPADDEPYYISLWTVDGELWVRNKTRKAYRVDPADGELLEAVPANQMRLGDRTIEFDRGWVDTVCHHEEFVAVMLDGAGHPGPSGKNVYVFDSDGTERWWVGDRLDENAPSDGPPFTNIWIDDGDLWGYAIDGYAYRFELETGELLETEWRK